MPRPLQCFGVGVVLLSLAPSGLAFSRGASRASCWDMIPGHIRAQPQDLKRGHVALRTSTSSYLPGQFITVTVRSSRDFMGFLLQARGVAGTGVGSTVVSPVLVGGSWTLTPPGTHTLRCLSEGDSLTHSDKQLKRNLSFVWRAPDAPMGDIRFYITVVQSYFVYWAGIESAAVRDGSRSPWTGSNVTGGDGGNLARQEDEVTALPAHKASKKQTQSYKPQETLTEVSRPFPEGNHLPNQAANERRNSSNILGSIQNAAKGSENDTYTTSGSVSGVTEEAETETGSPEGPKGSLQSTNHVPPMASFPPAEANLSPNITGPLFLPGPLASLPALKDGEIERNFEDPKPHTIPETKDTTLNSETTTTAIPSTNHGFHNTGPSRPTSLNRRKPIQDQTRSVKLVTQSSSSQPRRTSESQISLIKEEKGRQSVAQTQNLHIKLSLHSQTSSTKPLFPSQTGTSHTVPFSPEPSSMSRTSSPPLIRPFKNPTFQSFVRTHTTPPFSQAHPLSLQVLPIKPTSSLPPPENSPPGPKTRSRQTSPPQLQTAAPLSSPPQPQTLSGLTQVLLQTTPTQTQGQASYPQTDQSKSVQPAEALSILPLPWSQPHSHTAAPQTHTFVWKQTRQSIEGKEVKDPPSQAKLKTMRPILPSIPSATPSPSLSVSTPFSSTRTLLTSSFVDPTTPLHPSGGSALMSVGTSFTHGTLSSSPSSSSMKNQPKTAPALSALPSPSPISIPPHLLPFHPFSTSPLPSSLTSYTIPLSNSSNYPPLAPLISPVPLSTSTSSPFTSSQSIRGSTVSSPSFPTIPSSNASSTSSNSSPPSHPSSSSSSISTTISTSSPLNLSATSSSTSPPPEPSPAPRRSLYNPLTSSTSSPVPSQQLTIGQSLPIQNRIASSNPQPDLNLPTPRTVVLPNLDPNFDLNLGHELKPNLPKTDTKLPPNPPETPDKEGKHPDVTPRHSAWELGMLLGCSAGLGMALVVGVRYMCRQACGKQTEVTLNDRETEYGRGERGMLHVQECGDLVRVRRIRENSFVLLAEYDVLASPGD